MRHQVNDLRKPQYLDYDFLNNVDEKDVQIEFSMLSGYNFYKLPKGQIGNKAYLGIHVKSELPVRIVPIAREAGPISGDVVRWHQRFVQKPMTQKYFEWPVDLIEVKNGRWEYILCYVFPLKAYPNMLPIKDLLYQDKNSTVLDWRNKRIRDICRSILKVFSLLHGNGYAYNDFDINRIFYGKSTNQIFLRHTLNIRETEADGPFDSIDTEKIAPEFAPPYIYKKKVFFGEIDNYAICSLLFRLMIGRLPYEGKGLTNFGDVFDPIRDTHGDTHDYYFKHYHQFPHFIFDPDDDCNSLGPMSENDLPKERWKSLPESIRTMFCKSLANFSGTEEKHLILYTPEVWLKELNQACWNDVRRNDEGGTNDGNKTNI